MSCPLVNLSPLSQPSLALGPLRSQNAVLFQIALDAQSRHLSSPASVEFDLLTLMNHYLISR